MESSFGFLGVATKDLELFSKPYPRRDMKPYIGVVDFRGQCWLFLLVPVEGMRDAAFPVRTLGLVIVSSSWEPIVKPPTTPKRANFPHQSFNVHLACVCLGLEPSLPSWFCGVTSFFKHNVLLVLKKKKHQTSKQWWARKCRVHTGLPIILPQSSLENMSSP